MAEKNMESKKTTSSKKRTSKVEENLQENVTDTEKEKKVDNKKSGAKNQTKNKKTSTKKTSTSKDTTNEKNKNEENSKKTKPKTKSSTKPRNATKQAKKDDERIKKIIAEQLVNIETIEEKSKKIEDIEKKKDATKKQKSVKSEKYNPEEIAKKIQDKKKLPKEEKQKLYKSMGINVILAIAITIYFIFLNLGCLNIAPTSFLIDLKVFSLALIAITIMIFENAYSKDSGTITIIGIEFFIIAIITLVSIYIYILHRNLYTTIMNFIIMIIDLYYVIKATIIYINGKRKYKNSISDVKEIIDFS